MFDYYLEIFNALIKDLKTEKSVESSLSLMPATLRQKCGGGFLFAANYHQMPVEAFSKIRLRKGAKEIRIPKERG